MKVSEVAYVIRADGWKQRVELRKLPRELQWPAERSHREGAISRGFVYLRQEDSHVVSRRPATLVSDLEVIEPRWRAISARDRLPLGIMERNLQFRACHFLSDPFAPDRKRSNRKRSYRNESLYK